MHHTFSTRAILDCKRVSEVPTLLQITAKQIQCVLCCYVWDNQSGCFEVAMKFGVCTKTNEDTILSILSLFHCLIVSKQMELPSFLSLLVF